jgi:putative ABC transport system substrate-binding protein
VIGLKRRDFITLLGGAAVAWPLAARAQQPGMPVIGFLSHWRAPGPNESTPDLDALRAGLADAGYVEGRNLAIEYRWGNGERWRLPALAADLVDRQVAVIVASGALAPALAAKAATSTIPIVFSIGPDPVEIGLVASLNRPGGNVTGFSSLNAELGAKRLEILHELLPSAERFAVLVNPSNRNAGPLTRDAQATGSAIGRQIEIFAANTNREIDAAFANLLRNRADALLVSPDPLLDSRRVQLVTLAAHHRLPALYPFRENVEIGDLMSYGSSAADRDRQVGIYTWSHSQGGETGRPTGDAGG